MTTPATPPDERLRTAAEAASYLGVSRNYVYKLAQSGELPSHRIGTRVRFKLADLDAWTRR